MGIQEVLLTPGEYDRNQKYLQDRARCAEISVLLKQRLDEMYVSRTEASERFAELIGTSSKTARVYINEYLEGNFHRRISSAIRYQDYGRGRNRRGRGFLDTFSVFFGMLGLEEKDRILELTREVQPSFEYPLKAPSVDAVASQPSATVSVAFSDPTLAITDKQAEHLKLLALRYALMNRTRTS